MPRLQILRRSTKMGEDVYCNLIKFTLSPLRFFRVACATASTLSSARLIGKNKLDCPQNELKEEGERHPDLMKNSIFRLRVLSFIDDLHKWITNTFTKTDFLLIFFSLVGGENLVRQIDEKNSRCERRCVSTTLSQKIYFCGWRKSHVVGFFDIYEL